MVYSFFSDLRTIISYWAESHLEPRQTPTVELSCETTNGFNKSIISTKSTITDPSQILDRTLWMYFQLKVLSLLDVGGLQVYGICSRRLVHSEVVEARSNYKKFYLWWFKNLVCGDSSGSNQIEKEWVGVPPGLV